MADGIKLRLGRRDMNVFRTIETDAKVTMHVAGRFPVAMCPGCQIPSAETNGTGWRDVIDVVRTLVVTLSICVRRFVCANEACGPRTFDERFDGIDRGGASERALAFFADLARGRATAAVAKDLGVPQHYLRQAVGRCRRRATARHAGRLGRHLAIDECSLKKGHVYATGFSDPERGVVVDLAPGRDGAAIWAFAGLYSHSERAAVAVVSMDCHNAYRHMVRIVFPNADIVADAFHLHQRVLQALTEVRRAATVRIAKTRRGRPGQAKRPRDPLARARDRLDADPSPRGDRHRQVVAEVCALDPPLALAYQLKEAFRAAMDIAKSGDTELFEICLDIIDSWCRAAKLAAFVTPANSMRSWRAEIVNYARTGAASNAFADQPSHQEPEAPSPRLSHLDRISGPDPVVLRRSRRPQHRRDPTTTLSPARRRSQLLATSIRVDPISD